MIRTLACCMAFVLAGSFAAACDRGAKEGELCFTTTADSGDCRQGLVCAKCAESGNICVKAEGETYNGLRVPGRQCEKLTSVAEYREIGRGAPQ